MQIIEAHAYITPTPLFNFTSYKLQMMCNVHEIFYLRLKVVDWRQKVLNMCSTTKLNPVHLDGVVLIKVVSHHFDVLSGRFLHELQAYNSLVFDSALWCKLKWDLS